MEVKNEPVAVNKNSKDITAGSSGFQFRTPASIQDFTNSPSKQQALNTLWSQNLSGFIKQGMTGNPWNATNVPQTTNYYNPVENNPPCLYAQVPPWSAFPGRLSYNYPKATQAQLNQMADQGDMNTYGQINSDPCNPSSTVPYFPYGPRGWQDEYCEWAITRNTAGKITRIDFTCENPEYWNSVWQIDPNKVVEVYQQTLNKPQITLADLSLPGVVDPVTNRPVYNPLNKWNSGTLSNATQGGAMHLTSTPNTLQTEMGLATSATVQRTNPNPPPGTNPTYWSSSQFNDLICVAQYGQRFRNSDPNIGGNVNELVNGFGSSPLVVTIADPPGLYIQMPDFSSYVTPDGTPASQFWKIVRGSQTLNDQNGKPLPGNFILHAVFEVPASKNYTVSDITIKGSPINWGSQVAATFKIQIVASAYTTSSAGPAYPAVGSPATSYTGPLQLFYKDYFEKMYNTSISNPVNNPISLLSNSTYVPPVINVGTTLANMVLIVAEGTTVGTFNVTFDDPNIRAAVTEVVEKIYYAVPGNSKPGNYTALYLTVTVGANVKTGPHSVAVTSQGQPTAPVAMPALLTVSPVTVLSYVAWQNTGVVLTAQNKATIQYKSGLWTANPQDNGGQLYDANGNPVFIKAKAGYALPGADEGALIGRVGNNVFLVGNGPTTIPTGLSGELELCINDDLNGIYGAGLTDNIGSVIVTINVQ